MVAGEKSPNWKALTHIGEQILISLKNASVAIVQKKRRGQLIQTDIR